MAKRHNKNHAAGPVTIIRPGEQVAPADATAHDESGKPGKSAKPNKSARLLKKEAQAKRGTEAHADILAPADVEAHADVVAPAAVEAQADVVAPADVIAQAEVQAGDVAAQLPVEDAAASDASAAEIVPIVEMDMQSSRGPDADYGKVAPAIPEFDDASGALAQAIEVDPNTITAKPKQFESIPILPTNDSVVELGEQGMDAGEVESRPIRDWVPADPSSGRATVTFDLPDHDESSIAAAMEEPDANKGGKSNRKLKLNKLQKHARGASNPVAEIEPDPVAAPSTPRPVRPSRTPAFAKLTEYQELSLAHVPGLPEETDVPGHWRGVGFGLGGRRLVSAFDEVVEIMRMPQITHVPGTQPWMLGVANVRGTLLPVVDLKQFLEGERTVMHEGQRVLVVRQGGGNVAVLIDQLFGQRSFNDSQKAALVDDESRYGHFVKQMYRVGDSDWGVFSMSMLTRTPEFRQAAA